jgi:hypothetical protein
LIDPPAREAVLSFARRWKPDTALHLGDFTDLAAIMSNGSADSKEKPSDDFKAGREFLKEFFEASGASKRHLLLGNHEDRLWKLAGSSREVVAFAAQSGIKEIHATAAESGAKLLEYDNVKMVKLGNFSFFHGFIFSEQAVRDHAEAFEQLRAVHTHRVGVAANAPTTRRRCVGTPRRSGYALRQTNRSRLACQGFAFSNTATPKRMLACRGPKSDNSGKVFGDGGCQFELGGSCCKKLAASTNESFPPMPMPVVQRNRGDGARDPNSIDGARLSRRRRAGAEEISMSIAETTLNLSHGAADRR